MPYAYLRSLPLIFAIKYIVLRRRRAHKFQATEIGKSNHDNYDDNVYIRFRSVAN